MTFTTVLHATEKNKENGNNVFIFLLTLLLVLLILIFPSNTYVLYRPLLKGGVTCKKLSIIFCDIYDLMVV